MITQQDVEFYRDNGFLVLPDVLDEAALRALRGAVDRLVDGARAVTSNNALYDLEDDHTPGAPRVRRLKDPDRHDEAFASLRAHRAVTAVLSALWGAGVRFDKAKLNMKLPLGGAAVEWHQDWAFYPHTNDDLAAVGFMLDDVSEENGAMLVLPGSHCGPLYDHHADGVFCGAIDTAAQGVNLSAAVALTGRAGSITVHHVRTVHGSAPNRSPQPRRFLLHQYCAADAWPVGAALDYERYLRGIVAGEPTLAPRMTTVPIRLPLPPAPSQGSIYENQRALARRYFA